MKLWNQGHSFDFFVFILPLIFLERVRKESKFMNCRRGGGEGKERGMWEERGRWEGEGEERGRWEGEGKVGRGGEGEGEEKGRWEGAGLLNQEKSFVPGG